MQTILTLTINPTVDESTSVESVASEIKLRCDQPRYDPGGGGINVARAIKKLGGRATALYTKGGPNGELLENLLDEEGIDQRPIRINGMTRESFTVFERSTTLQYRFGMPGPDMRPDEWKHCLDMAIDQPCDLLVGSGSLPPGVPDDFYAQLSRRGTEKGIKVILDTSGKPLEKTAGSGVYLLKPNIGELETLIGKPFSGEHALKEAAQSLIRDGMAAVFVISLGAGGAALVTQDEYIHYHAPVVPVQSKVGAGDSMVGGLTWALAEGKTLAEAVRHGIAAGTAAVMRPGTQLCRREDAEMLYHRVGMKVV